MKDRRRADEVPSAREVLPPLLSTEGLLEAGKALALRRKLVDPAKLREIGQAYEHYDAGLRSRWDSYEDAIAAAKGDPDPLVRAIRSSFRPTRSMLPSVDGKRVRKPNPDRLVDLLRARKPLADGDRVRLAAYLELRTRRRRWPPWLEDALNRTPTEEQYGLLADLVAKVGRKPHRVADAPAHRAARLARVLLGRGRIDARLRTAMISIASKIEGDESGVDIDSERVRNVLDHPGARDTKR